MNSVKKGREGFSSGVWEILKNGEVGEKRELDVAFLCVLGGAGGRGGIFVGFEGGGKRRKGGKDEWMWVV